MALIGNPVWILWCQIYGSEIFSQAFCLDIGTGESVALVGPSGSGKSTCMSLLLRLYEPSAGLIAIDGRDIKEMNVKWLRSQMRREIERTSSIRPFFSSSRIQT